MSYSAIKTTEWRLKQWGRWAFYKRGISFAWHTIEPYERMAHERMGDEPPRPEITDQEAEAMDRAISLLACVNRQQHEALAVYYLYKPTYRDLGNMLKCHHATAQARLDGGRAWLDGYLRGTEDSVMPNAGEALQTA